MSRSCFLKIALPGALLGACASLVAFDAFASGRMATALSPEGTARGSLEAATQTEREVVAAAPFADGGWVYLGPQRASVDRLVLSPVDPSKLLAVLDSRNETPVGWTLFETTRSGEEWQSNFPLGGLVSDATIDGDGRDFAVRIDSLNVRQAGASVWQTVPRPAAFNGLFFSVASGGHPGGPVFVGAVDSNGQRIFRLSNDLGAWTEITPALAVPGWGAQLAVSATPGRVAVATWEQSSPRVFVSSDDGATWSLTVPPVALVNISTLRWVGDRLFIGGVTEQAPRRTTLWATGDGGASWQPQIQEGGFNGFGIDVVGHPTQPGLLWAANADGVYRSTDGGVNWQPPAAGAMTDARRLAYDPQSNVVWAAFGDTGVWRSDDAGDTWQPRNHRLGAQPVVGVAANPLQPADMAVAIDSVVSADGQVSTSDNGGLSWLDNVAPFAGGTGNVRFAPTGTLFATVTGPFTRDSLFRREANGEWTHVGFQVPDNLQFVPGDLNFGLTSDTVLVHGAVYDNDTHQWTWRVWRSGDGGGSWQQVLLSDSMRPLTGIERAQGPNGVRVFVLEQSRFVSQSSRLLASDDDGQTWFDATPDIASGSQGRMCTGSNGEVLLTVNAPSSLLPRLFRSEDAGGTWTQTEWVSGSGIAGAAITAMHCPGDAHQVFLGGSNGQLWVSQDGGNSFVAQQTAATWGAVEVKSIQLTPSALYVGHRNGVWANPDVILSSRPIALAATRTDSRMRYRVSLTWERGDAQVEVRRNGGVVATVDNAGSWSGMVLAAPPGEQWQVCSAFGGACSEAVTLGR